MKKIVVVAFVSFGLGVGFMKMNDNEVEKESVKVETENVTENKTVSVDNSTVENVKSEKVENKEIKDFKESFNNEDEFYEKYVYDESDMLDYYVVKAMKLEIDNKEIWALTDFNGFIDWKESEKIGLVDGRNYIIQVGRYTNEVYEIWNAGFNFSYENNFENAGYIEVEKSIIQQGMNNNDVTSLDNVNYQEM